MVCVLDNTIYSNIMVCVIDNTIYNNIIISIDSFSFLTFNHNYRLPESHVTNTANQYSATRLRRTSMLNTELSRSRNASVLNPESSQSRKGSIVNSESSRSRKGSIANPELSRLRNGSVLNQELLTPVKTEIGKSICRSQIDAALRRKLVDSNVILIFFYFVLSFRYKFFDIIFNRIYVII